MVGVATARRALRYAFRVTAADPWLAEWFEELFAGLPAAAPGEPVAEWAVARVEDTEPQEWRLVLEGEEHSANSNPDALVTTIVQRLNQEAVRSWPGAVGHAGCVSRDGLAIVMPADPESGKTTLTCGLVRAGLTYVTDEGVAFEPGTARIEPFPKPLSLDRGSWFLFPELEPVHDARAAEFERSQWQVPPAAIRSGAVSGPCTARFLVFPKYVEGATTALAPMTRAEALIALAKNTFHFNQHSRESLDQLEVVVRACDCYRLTVGALDDAVACIEELVSGA
jgi:hypothetical protein